MKPPSIKSKFPNLQKCVGTLKIKRHDVKKKIKDRTGIGKIFPPGAFRSNIAHACHLPAFCNFALFLVTGIMLDFPEMIEEFCTKAYICCFKNHHFLLEIEFTKCLTLRKTSEIV